MEIHECECDICQAGEDGAVKTYHRHINLVLSRLDEGQRRWRVTSLAGGTSTLAMRLPEPQFSEMMAIPGYSASYKYPSSIVYAKSMGPDWVLLKAYQPRNPDLCRAAYDYAATFDGHPPNNSG